MISTPADYFTIAASLVVGVGLLVLSVLVCLGHDPKPPKAG